MFQCATPSSSPVPGSNRKWIICQFPSSRNLITSARPSRCQSRSHFEDEDDNFLINSGGSSFGPMRNGLFLTINLIWSRFNYLHYIHSEPPPFTKSSSHSFEDRAHWDSQCAACALCYLTGDGKEMIIPARSSSWVDGNNLGYRNNCGRQLWH